MGEYKNKAFTLRIDENIMDKIKAIAEEEERTANKQIEKILKIYINDYEQKNGSINTVNIGRDNNGTINMK